MSRHRQYNIHFYPFFCYMLILQFDLCHQVMGHTINKSPYPGYYFARALVIFWNSNNINKHFNKRGTAVHFYGIDAASKAGVMPCSKNPTGECGWSGGGGGCRGGVHRGVLYSPKDASNALYLYVYIHIQIYICNHKMR